MTKHIDEKSNSESWKNQNWKKFQRQVFRLQRKIYKAVREGDMAKARRFQKLLMGSHSARMLAVRQVTQLNGGKKTAGIDGKKALNFHERFELVEKLNKEATNWKHSKLREIPIPKKNGKTRILKVPTIADRAWQCLVKYVLEPAHEATFHARSYGFRTGRSAHDAQRYIFANLKSRSNGKDKRILELDIKKCFDRINHTAILNNLISPQCVKRDIQRCLVAGINPEFPEQGTPQGGVVSPLLANIALNGIESIHPSVRYADDMVFFLKSNDNAELILDKVEKFLAERGMRVSQEKTKVTATTDGFNFLGWQFIVQHNGKFKCYPSKDNYKAVKEKIKEVVKNSNYGARVKAKKLAPIIRGWRNYHKYCKMDGYSLIHTEKRTWKVFNKETKLNRYKTNELIKQAFPDVSYSENRFVMIAGDKSPYNGDTVYWAKRNSKLYDGKIAKILNKQNHSCGHCGLKFINDERVHLHHIDGKHNNWKHNNLIVVHESCHDYIHMGKRESSPN
jgi:group II intron reverse transcriptase/maturase